MFKLIKFLSGKKNPPSRIDNEKDMPYDVEKDLQYAIDGILASKDTSIVNSTINSGWQSRIQSRSNSQERQK